MQFFSYKVVSKTGKILRGKFISNSDKELLEYLTSIGFTILEIRPLKKNIFTKLFSFLEKLSLKDKIFISRNISLILRSGANLIDGLKALAQSIKNRKLRDFFLFLVFNIENGAPFYNTFEYFTDSFSQVEIELIKVGEVSGNLSKTFDKLAEDLEKEKNIRSEIISSLMYPVIILIAALGVIVLVSTIVLPRIAEIVIGMKTKLPFISKIILTSGLWIGAHLKIFISSIIFFILANLFLFSTKRGRALLLKIALKLPILKNIILNTNLRSFYFIMKSLIEGGINISQALYLTSTVINYPDLKRAIERLTKEIQEGGDFAEAIKTEKAFPEMVGVLISIGYDTGNLSMVLGLLEEFYEDELRYSIRNLLTFLEPALTIFVGLIVGMIAVSIILPVYQQISTQIEQSLKARGAGGI